MSRSAWMLWSSNPGARSCSDESGQVSILVILATLFVFLGMLALVIDLGFAFSVRAELQNCVDAAALAGAREANIIILEQKVRSVDQFYEEANRRSTEVATDYLSKNGCGQDESEISPIQADNQYSVKVVASRRVTTAFGRVLGREYIDIQAAYVASLTAR